MRSEHFNRVYEGANNVYNLHNLSAYVEKHIRLEGEPYRFGDKFGFQAAIINNTSRVTNTIKPAQIGLTTANMAYILALTCTQKRMSAIYSLPTSNDAEKLVATKLDPMIDGSPEVLRLVDPDVNNYELKRINGNSIFIRGTRSDTAGLSISADVLVADEVDRSDAEKLKQFRSRLQGSEHQIIQQFSTPTVSGYGISKAAEDSVRNFHFATCGCCGHKWLPSYHTDIVVPGWDRDLKELSASNIITTDWKNSRWNCPNCGKDPLLHPSRLEWVAENPLQNYEAKSYFVTPVTACLTVLRPSYLVRTSTEYEKRSEWCNQVLGETSEDSNEQIVRADIESAELEADLRSSDIHYLGADMGLLCAVTIGRPASDGSIIVVHREMVPADNFKVRRAELMRQYRCLVSVHDAYPYTTLVTEITDHDANAYGTIFSATKNPELFVLSEKEEDLDAGKLNLRLLKVNRTVGLDNVRDLIKESRVLFQKCDSADQFRMQYLTLKRVKTYLKDELVHSWQKTGKGNDHMHFSLLYLFLAIKLRGRLAMPLNAQSTNLVSAYRLKT